MSGTLVYEIFGHFLYHFFQFYRDYEIPHEFIHLWRYIRDACNEPAFHETCPGDEDLLKFTYSKFNDSERTDLRKRGISGKFGTKHASVNMDDEDADVLKKTTGIPADVAEKLDNLGENGQQEEDE